MCTGLTCKKGTTMKKLVILSQSPGWMPSKCVQLLTHPVPHSYTLFQKDFKDCRSTQPLKIFNFPHSSSFFFSSGREAISPRWWKGGTRRMEGSWAGWRMPINSSIWEAGQKNHWGQPVLQSKEGEMRRGRGREGSRMDGIPCWSWMRFVLQ